MNDLAKQDLEGVVSYLLETEREDFGLIVCENPAAFPGLTEKEVEELSNIAPGERCEELIEKAALCEANRHVYACAFRLQHELETMNGGECKTVTCSMCGEDTPANTAHLHQGKWIGDACCWDERLRASE